MSNSQQLIERAKQSAKLFGIAATARDLSAIPPQELSDGERVQILKLAVKNDLDTQRNLKDNPLVQKNASKAGCPSGSLSPDLPDENLPVNW